MTAYSFRALVGRGCGFTVGPHTYGDLTVRWFGEEHRLQVGSFCSLAGGIWVYMGGNHLMDRVSTYPFGEETNFPRGQYHAKERLCIGNGSVVIGNDVWIGDRATIMSGVTVGHGAIIAANATVTKDVAPYAIVAGNPAVLKGYRVPEVLIADLLRIRWWDWREDILASNIDLMLGKDIPAFISKGLEISTSLGFFNA